MMKKFFRSLGWLCLYLLFAQVQSFAQNFIDAQRFSAFDFKGTARSMGVNGSMGALGADFSAISVNPAGIGMYRSSAITLTPSFLSNRIESTLEGVGNRPLETIEDRFALTNLGVVFANQPIGSPWVTANFGISLQQIGNFNGRLNFEGSSVGSIVDRFQELANSDLGLDNFESGLAFDAGALYDVEDDGFFESDVELAPDAVLLRRQEIFTEGAMNELQISMGGNFKEKLIVGFAIGIPNLTYTEDRTYEEEDPNDEVPFYDFLRFGERFSVEGNGINLKAGVIFRLNQMIRVGAAVHTPTTWNLDEIFTTGLTYQFTDDNGFNEIDAFSPEGNFTYRLVTPWRFIGSFGAVIEKSGFITAEVELVNYGSAKFRFDGFDDDEAIVNDNVDFFLRNTVNVRVGGEYVLNNFRFRAGGGIQTSAFEEEENINYSFGLGAGFRANQFFIALGYNINAQEDSYTPYIVTDRSVQNVQNTRQLHRLAISGGVRF